jgi:aryl-alcohol dehydrogenase-like predicted oxidoreductase
MEQRSLGRTGLRVSVLGLGSGGMNRLGQKHGLAKADIVRLVREALDSGINMIDTAPAYQASEELLGEALVGVPRDSYVLATKFQPRGQGGGPMKEPGELKASLEDSLRKLRTDYVDVLYLHGVTPQQYDAISDRFVEPLLAARNAGLAHFTGATELFERDHDHEALQRAMGADWLDVAMLGFNLLSPAAVSSVLPLARQHNVGIVVMCAIRSVISDPEVLRGTIRKWKEEGLLSSDAVPDDAPLDWLLGPDVQTLTDAAYKFAAAQDGVSCVLTGTANPGHLAANVHAVEGASLSPELNHRVIDTFAPIGRNASHPDFQ